MFDLDKWTEIYATVSKHKLRTFLTAFGVFWAFSCWWCCSGRATASKTAWFPASTLPKTACSCGRSAPALPTRASRPGRFVQFTNDDVDAIRRTIPEVAILAPRNFLPGNYTVNRGTKNEAFNVYGEYPDFTGVRPVQLSSGRFINYLDIRDRRKVAVIGTQVRKVLFKEDEDPVGQYISIKGAFFLVVGVFGARATWKTTGKTPGRCSSPAPRSSRPSTSTTRWPSSPWCPSPACGRP
jgi:putative ABC transport system permease protein